jgi:hypothetical protein
MTDEQILELAKKAGLYPFGVFSNGDRFINTTGHALLKFVKLLRGNDGVMVAPAPQPDESKLPPRPAGSNDADTDPDSPLKRYGRASKESGLLLEPMADGYWTPWHIANELLRAATGKDGVSLLDDKTVSPDTLPTSRKDAP